jgi:hypothetical protein
LADEVRDYVPVLVLVRFLRRLLPFLRKGVVVVVFGGAFFGVGLGLYFD